MLCDACFASRAKSPLLYAFGTCFRGADTPSACVRHWHRNSWRRRLVPQTLRGARLPSPSDPVLQCARSPRPPPEAAERPGSRQAELSLPGLASGATRAPGCFQSSPLAAVRKARRLVTARAELSSPRAECCRAAVRSAQLSRFHALEPGSQVRAEAAERLGRVLVPARVTGGQPPLRQFLGYLLPQIPTPTAVSGQ